MSFWTSGSGAEITGSPEAAFVPDFSVIPDGTKAFAKIKNFELTEQPATPYLEAQKFYQLTWTLTQGEFKNRQVTQKIKCFAGTPSSIDRNLNMLKRIMDLCNFKPMHNEAPRTVDLQSMVGTVLGIKIREWSQPKKDGSGVMEGNFVSEVHPVANFEEEVGHKLEPKEVFASPLETAFSRNATRSAELDDSDIPF